ncbi:hypothetical protein, partial [Enterobacter sichuanensis]
PPPPPPPRRVFFLFLGVQRIFKVLVGGRLVIFFIIECFLYGPNQNQKFTVLTPGVSGYSLKQPSGFLFFIYIWFFCLGARHLIRGCLKFYFCVFMY